MTLRRNVSAANARKRTDRAWRTLLLVLAVPIGGVSTWAQCPTGTVTVTGRLENLPEGSKDAQVLVILDTKKGKFSHAGTASDGAFSVDVPFDTQKSPYSPFGGHHCTNLPKSVTVKVSRAGRRLGERALAFKGSFERQDSFNKYRLKQNLTIDLSKAAMAKP